MIWLMLYLAAGAVMMLTFITFKVFRLGGIDLPPREEILEIAILIVGSLTLWPMVLAEAIWRWKQEHKRLQAKPTKKIGFK